MRAIDLKVVRELWRMRGQFLAIAAVIACGVGVYLGMRATMFTLVAARANYYAHQRFGDVFCSLERAPERIAERLETIPGVQAVQTRVVADVTLDIEGMVEAASGRLVSIPDRGRPAVNDLSLETGRWPERGAPDEVVASQAFFEAHRFELGDRVRAIVNGRYVDLALVGVGLSPEYTYSVGPGMIIPDDRRFGVLWMRREALAAAFDMDGAFNDVSLRVSRDASVERVIQRTDQVLDRYGGLGAIPRADQSSAFFLANELTQLDTFSFFVPVLFLIVAAFLLNIVFGRLIAGQRSDIAALKSFGYLDREVGFHYVKLIGTVVLLGWGLGVGLGAFIGHGMTHMYGEYYRFPELTFRVDWSVALQGLAITLIGAGFGAWGSVRRTIRLAPADGLRPEAPPAYRPTFFERLGLSEALPTALRLILRELERRPTRALFAGLGVAFATALTIAMSFSLDSMNLMLNLQYGLSQREDVQLTLAKPRSLGVVSELEHLPGVIHADPYRAVPVRLRNGRLEEKTQITGVRIDSPLLGLLDEHYRDVEVPAEGLVLTRKLADLLHVRAGDDVIVDVLEGARPRRRARVARVAQNFVGMSGYMSLEAVATLLREPVTLNGARLLVDDAQLPDLHAEVKRTPLIAGVSSRDSVVRLVRSMLDQNLGVFVTVAVGFSLVMAFGVLYNVIRITLAERARELATLRVLGFRRKEVTAILFGELALVLVLAIPIGCVLGYALALALSKSPGFDTEQFRIPFIVTSRSYAMAILTVSAAALASGWGAWRKLDRFDIIEVLKTRD